MFQKKVKQSNNNTPKKQLKNKSNKHAHIQLKRLQQNKLNKSKKKLLCANTCFKNKLNKQLQKNIKKHKENKQKTYHLRTLEKQV